MNTSSPTSIKPRSPASFLFRGPPGGGKTTLAMQFPRVWFADIDLNTNGPEAYLRAKDKNLSYSYDLIPFDDAGNRLEFPSMWERMLAKTDEAIKDPKIDTICIDGLTHLNNILIHWVLKQQNAKSMERQYWIPFRMELMKIVMKCRTSGKTIIMMAHEEAQLDKQGIVESYKIAVSSKLVHFFGGFFTDIYRFETRPAPMNKAKYLVTCAPTARCELKTSFPNMPGEIDVTASGFGELNKYMQLPIRL